MSVVGDIFGAGGVASLISKVSDKIWPDPLERQKQQLAILQLEQAGAFKEIDTQVELARQQAAINAEEAKSTSVFVSGWRPAIGWVCAASLSAQFIGAPLLAWASSIVGIPQPPVTPDWAQLMPVMFGMLGLGTMRTIEKINGVAAK